MKIIGITGGVGAGKTQILEYLNNKYGATICQADQVGKKLQKKGTPCFEAIVEAALLIEDNYEEICDELWYVYVEDEIRKKRLIYARGYDARKVDDIIAAQLPKDVFLKHCDRVIDNNGVFEETKMQLDQIVADL